MMDVVKAVAYFLVFLGAGLLITYSVTTAIYGADERRCEEAGGVLVKSVHGAGVCVAKEVLR